MIEASEVLEGSVSLEDGTEERGLWREVFVTTSVRIVVPVGRV